MEDIVFCADVGGTNTSMGIVGTKGRRPRVLLRRKTATRSIDDFAETADEFLDDAGKKGFKPSGGCIAAAGVIKKEGSEQKVEMTNAGLSISSSEVKDKTGLDRIRIINDFEALSCSTNFLSGDSVKVLREGKPVKGAARAVVGAGTGLGKCAMRFDKKSGSYVPFPSEGGHEDLPLLSGDELRMAETIKRIGKIRGSLVYEDVLSGRGLERLYEFLRKTRFRDSREGLSAEEISETRDDVGCSREAFRLFVRFYARCCRNFVLDTLARGGLYIGGGIAAGNPDSFGDDFIEEFTSHETFRKMLKDVPVTLILESDAGLLGAAFACRR